MATIQKAFFEKRATAVGTYWTSRAPKAQIREYLRDCALSRFKAASIGGEQEQGFEQAFASLAYAYLKDKSPRLLDFIVGFQLVDRNEDNTKAMGLFGFKVGDQWLYAPVFFLNGDLKGHELLYIKKQDAFVPMKENWVNYLISRKPHVLGEPSDKNTHQLSGLMPSLSKLQGPPSHGTKTGSYRPHIDAWARDFLAFIGAADTKSDKLFAKHAALTETLDLRNFLKEFPLLKMAFEKCYMAYPLIKKGFDRFYGKDFFEKMALAIKEREKKARSYIMPPKPVKKTKPPQQQKSGPDWSLIDDPQPEDHPIKSGALQIVVHDSLSIMTGGDGSKGQMLDLADSILPDDVADKIHEAMKKSSEDNKVEDDVPGTITQNKNDLTDEERERLLKDTVLIKDKRDPHQTSVAYNTQTRLELVNPMETGLYEILEKPGTFSQMVVIAAPQTGRGRERFAVVLRKDSPRNWLNTHATNLWAKQCDCPTREDWKKYVDGLGGTDSLEVGGTYVAVHENGSGTTPFRIKENYGDGAYKVEWRDYCQYGHDRLKSLPKSDKKRDWEIGYSSWDAKIWINQKKGSGLRSVNGELNIPSTYKIIKVAEPPKPKKEDDGDSLIGCCSPEPLCSGQEGSDEQPIQPGNLVDIQTMIHQKEAKLSIHATGGNEFYLKSVFGNQPVSKKACLITLVRDHGLSELQARAIIKEAEHQGIRNRASHYYIKYANGFGMLQPGPGAPAFPEPMMGVEMNGPNAVSSIYPQEENIPVDEMSSQLTDPSIYDPFYQPDQNAMQVAQQAANSGQKEVFDTSMISGMLKAVRQDSLVDRYLGDLMKALDKLGRIMFMFYWHQEEFEDRYGKQDLPELEDSLRNAFEVLGDVCLFLKEKTVQGGAGIEMAGVGGANAEPNIEEAARN